MNFSRLYLLLVLNCLDLFKIPDIEKMYQKVPRMASTNIDPANERFPYCIVWTPIPCITWLFPFIGHTGIGDSNGVIYDFAGPYHIGSHHLAFGKPARYIQLDPSKCVAAEWDEGIKLGNDIYKQRMHNLVWDNCHNHVAKCLNSMGYEHHTKDSMIRIGVWMFFQGKFVDINAVVRSYLPFTLILGFVVLITMFVQ